MLGPSRSPYRPQPASPAAPNSSQSLFQHFTVGENPRLGVLRIQREQHGTAIPLVQRNVRFALSVAHAYSLIESGEIVNRDEAVAPGVESAIAARLGV